MKRCALKIRTRPRAQFIMCWLIFKNVYIRIFLTFASSVNNFTFLTSSWKLNAIVTILVWSISKALEKLKLWIWFYHYWVSWGQIRKKNPKKNNNQKTKTKQNPKNPQKTQKPHLLDKPKARLWCLWSYSTKLWNSCPLGQGFKP